MIQMIPSKLIDVRLIRFSCLYNFSFFFSFPFFFFFEYLKKRIETIKIIISFALINIDKNDFSFDR